MWAAHLPPELDGQHTSKLARMHETVVGYFVKEEEAVEARRKAMSERHKKRESMRGQSIMSSGRDPAKSSCPTNGMSRHWERGQHRNKKNRMHVEEVLSAKQRTFRKYNRDTAWHPLQHSKARDREAAKVDLHANEVIPTHDDHGAYACEDQEHFKQIEATSLPPLPTSPRMGHKKDNRIFRRENLLDLDQMTRLSRLDRDRRANNGRMSYNNFARRKHAWMHSQALMQERRRAAAKAMVRAEQINQANQFQSKALIF